MSNLLKGAALFIGGALAGAAAILALSPETAKKVRDDLSDVAGEVKKRAQECCEQVKEQGAKIKEQVQSQLQEQSKIQSDKVQSTKE